MDSGEATVPYRLPCRVMARGMNKTVARLAERWRIVEIGNWDRDAIDLVDPGFVEFTQDGTGQLGPIAVSAWLDCRPVERDGLPGVETTERSKVTCTSIWTATRPFRAEPFSSADRVGE